MKSDQRDLSDHGCRVDVFKIIKCEFVSLFPHHTHQDWLCCVWRGMDWKLYWVALLVPTEDGRDSAGSAQNGTDRCAWEGASGGQAWSAAQTAAKLHTGPGPRVHGSTFLWGITQQSHSHAVMTSSTWSRDGVGLWGQRTRKKVVRGCRGGGRVRYPLPPALLPPSLFASFKVKRSFHGSATRNKETTKTKGGSGQLGKRTFSRNKSTVARFHLYKPALSMILSKLTLWALRETFFPSALNKK